jgi:hypothetical protein
VVGISSGQNRAHSFAVAAATLCWTLFADAGSLPVTVYGQTRDSLFGRFRVLVAIARMIYLSLLFALWHSGQFDVVVVDQVAHAVPMLRWTTKCKVGEEHGWRRSDQNDSGE